MLPAAHHGMEETLLMTLPQDLFSLLLGDRSEVSPDLEQDLGSRAHQDFPLYRTVAPAGDLAAVARSQGYRPRSVYYFLGFGKGKEIAMMPLLPVGVSHPPRQPADQGEVSEPGQEEVEPQKLPLVFTVETEGMVHGASFQIR